MTTANQKPEAVEFCQPLKVSIQLRDGRWWINEKQHKHCNAMEQYMFNSFLRFVRRAIDKDEIENLSAYLRYRFQAWRGGCVDVLHIDTGKKTIVEVLNFDEEI